MGQESGCDLAGFFGAGSLVKLQSQCHLGLQSHLLARLRGGSAALTLTCVVVSRPQFLMAEGLSLFTWAAPQGSS